MKKCVRYLLILAFIFTIIWGQVLKDYNVLLAAATCIWGAGIIFSVENIERRLYLFMFEITFFVFTLSRPIIGLFRKESWWEIEQTARADVYFALIIIIVSQIGVLLGSWFIEEVVRSKQSKYCNKEINTYYIKNVQIISQILFYVSGIFNLIQELEKLLAVKDKGYLAYYTDFEPQFPFWIYTIASFMTVSLCIYLSTWPKKRQTLIPFGVYFLSAVPSLVLGVRNPIMLRAVFIVLYFLFRQFADKKEKWVGKIERCALIIGIPATLIFMTLYSYIRSGMQVVGSGVLKLFVDFFYGQGVTFNVLAIGHNCIPRLPDRTLRNYTFGGILDYFLHGTLAQRLFGAEALDSGNTIKNALESNSFAHNMSYIAKGRDYLNGEGWGSSYLLEVFTDYSYVGVLLFSLILGILLIYAIDLLKKGLLLRTIVFMSLQSIFFIPRAEATGWISFLFTVQFWLAIVGIFLGAKLCGKKYTIWRAEDV